MTADRTDEQWAARYRCSFVFPNGQRCVQPADSHSPLVHTLGPPVIDWSATPDYDTDDESVTS